MAILNLTGMRSGGGTSEWTDVTEYFVDENGDPVITYAQTFEAYSNGSMVWVSFTELQIGELANDKICISEEGMRPAIAGSMCCLGVVFENNDQYAVPICCTDTGEIMLEFGELISGSFCYPIYPI